MYYRINLHRFNNFNGVSICIVLINITNFDYDSRWVQVYTTTSGKFFNPILTSVRKGLN